MIEFTHKHCPYCRLELYETDDVVACSNCDTIHHRECWMDNQGCSTFGCTGIIQELRDNPFDQDFSCFNTVARGNEKVSCFKRLYKGCKFGRRFKEKETQ